MSSLSSRTGLTLMADGDFVNPAVIDNNSTALDNITSVTECISTARPTSPFEGQVIYETDTQNMRRYSASNALWYLMGGSNAGVGFLGNFSDTSAQLLTGGGSNPTYGTVSLLDYSFTVKANWNYKIIEQGFYMFTGTYNGSNTGDITIELYNIYGLGSQPSLSATANGLHYMKTDYVGIEMGQRRPYFKKMDLTTPSNFSGTAYIRSIFRVNTALWIGSNHIGRPSDTIGSYAWVYDLGPATAGY